MEEQVTTNGKKQTKKILIICGSIVLAAAIALVLIIVFTNQTKSNQPELINGNVIKDFDEMSFEEFCMGMKEDLPQETMDEVRRLYEEMQQAFADGDFDKINGIYEELNQMDVYEFDMSDMSQGDVTVMDENGNAIEWDELPDEIKEIIEQ